MQHIKSFIPESSSTKLEAFLRRNSFLAPIVIFLACLLVYHPVRHFDYLAIDDGMHTEGNPRIYPPTFENILSFWTTPYENAYTPITYTLWAVQAALGKNSPIEQEASKSRMNPQGNKYKPGFFHTTNVLVHFMTSFVCFLLLQLLLSNSVFSLIGALLFTVHPVQVETVCWITGFRDVLAGMFCMLALFYYCKYQLLENPNGRYFDASNLFSRKTFFYGLSLVCFIAGVLCKSSALMTPIIASLICFAVFRRNPLHLLLDFIPWAVLILPIMKVFFGLNDSVAMKVVFIPALPWRFVIALDSITFYLSKLFFPLTLTMDYGRTPQAVLGEGWYRYTAGIPIILGLLTLFIAYWKRNYWPLICLLVYVVGLGPILGITPFIFQHISTTADRYVYLSMFAVAFGSAILSARYFSKPAYLFTCTVVLCLFTLKSMKQVWVWENNHSLFSQSLRVTPKSWLSSNDLGTVYEGKGELEIALGLYERSGEISNIPSAWNNAGAMAFQLKEYDKAVELFLQALKSSNGSSWAHNNVGTAYYHGGNKKLGMLHLKQAREADPRYNFPLTQLKILRKDEGPNKEAISQPAPLTKG